MHEIGICEAVLDAVSRRANGRAVRRIVVRAGTLHRIAPDAFQQAFILVAGAGIAEGAATELIAVPAVARCSACKAETATDDPIAVCPACGSTSVELTGGEELTLESIEYRVAEPVTEGAVEA
jgi:hydrogenase nickel incorporation protein HypA/HybF